VKPFEIFYPAQAKDAALLLREKGDEARILAGGTDLLVSMGKRLCSPKYLVSLRKISGMQDHRWDENFLRVGSLATLRDMEWPKSREEEPMEIFFQAVRSIGSVQVRNQGTLGGNICQEPRCLYYNHSSFWREALKACLRRGGNQCYVLPGSKKCVAGYYSDTAPALLALDSKVNVLDVMSLEEQVLDIEEFYKRRAFHQQIFIVKEIRIPNPKLAVRGIYIKYRGRKNIGFASMSAAILLISAREDHHVQDARFIIGGTPDYPKRIWEAEERLKGEHLNERLVEEVAQIVSKEMPMFSDPFLSRDNKRRIMAALIRRELRSLA
jgi:CO/xanthine dehydrogenase FAD-binding subunit